MPAYELTLIFLFHKFLLQSQIMTIYWILQSNGEHTYMYKCACVCASISPMLGNERVISAEYKFV